MIPATVWGENHLDRIQDEEIATIVLDLCVKHGGRQGIRMLQQAMNDAAQWNGQWVPEDGELGDATLAFLRGLKATDVIRSLKRFKQTKAA